MKVILLKPVSNLGLAGSVVNVSDGFAVNFLIPNKLASGVSSATPVKVEKSDNRPITEQGKKLLADVSHIKITLKAKANEQGKLYEAIKPGQVASLLRAKKKLNVKADQIRFAKPIKEVGEHVVDLKIASQISNFKLIVEKL